jgi:hypothetical protein
VVGVEATSDAGVQGPYEDRGKGHVRKRPEGGGEGAGACNEWMPETFSVDCMWEWKN